ncbi:actin cytoskeleton organization and cell cycle progression protein [Sistotremastrum niveocremeum HHB9708]|uniref:Protein SDA1 n=1 Tax=Sistotremastrum niveocremeum HHB9708 TaxID=1314777 RepID=A0A164VCE4_9AGAM|nr:actin cytoskeleton organization and cell cycle progression protein [Sistotremastrum niveocremeum HHB9708]
MGRQHTSRGALLTSNLPQLQNMIKRDPIGYRDEFMQQWNHYDSIRKIFKISPEEQASHFRELVSFISQVASCYPKETAEFPSHLSTLLLESYATLTPEIRQSLVQNLVLLRNKGVITSITLLQTLFPLLPRTTSSTLRSFIRKTILSDIKTANLKTKNHKLNRAVQAMLFGMVERGMSGEVIGDKGKMKAGAAGDAARQYGAEAMWAVVLAKELWKKSVWNDSKTVSIIALGCFHPVTKVQSASIHFFLGSENEEEKDSDDEEEIPDAGGLKHRREINKKTRSGEKKIAKQLKTIRKKEHNKRNAPVTANFSALQLLNDPQTFAEKLYDYLAKHDKRLSLDHKVLIMQLLSRVMGSHKLCVLSFYTYIIRYLAYHQLQVTVILVSLAQSVHELTPPDVLTPVIRKLATEFVHPGVGSEVIAAGINAIREVCKRQPWCMEEDLLGDLIAYRKSRDKAAMTAGRSMLQLYREVNPGMLKRRERGKEATMNNRDNKPLPFGHNPDTPANIEGLELLEDHLDQMRKEAADGADGEGGLDEDDDAAWEGWDVESDSEEESDSDGWNNVSDDDDDLVISDSDDEKDKSSSKSKTKTKSTSDDEKEKDDEMKDEVTETNEEKTEEVQRVSTLATTKILTPADFALLNDLRIKAANEAIQSGQSTKSLKRKLASLEASRKASSQNPDAFLSESDILGPRKKAKSDYAERMASIQEGREGREKFGSSKGKKNKEVMSSSTNREKKRNKPIMMIMASGAVRSKKKASLREKQRKLRAHIEKGKRGGH